MNTPAVALAWELWWRHRWGLAAAAALVAGFAAACAAVPLSANAATASSLWFVLALCYVIGVFAHGSDGRLEAAASGFPARQFVLPVRTSVLVGWPMVQGMAVAVALWVGWDRLVLRPSGVPTPEWWTPMLAAVVAVSQALVWVPFGLPWVRLVAAVAVLTALARAPMLFALVGHAFEKPADEARTLTAVALALIPAAFLAAWVGVGRARRGDDREWLTPPAAAGGTGTAAECAPFPSADRAQLWYEWRSRGRGFVVAVVCFLGVLLALAVLVRVKVGWHVMDNVLLLSVPFVVASFWGYYSAESGRSDRSTRLTAFAATRPLDNAALVVAKYRAAGLASVAAWVVVFAVVGLWAVVTDIPEERGELWGRLVAQFGLTKLVVGCVAHLLGVVLLTWRMLVVVLWSGLSGRPWVGLAQAMVAMLFVFGGLHELAMWHDLDRRARLLAVLPWVAGVAVAVKLTVAGWAARELVRRGEMRDLTAAWVFVVWVAAAAGVFALLAWLLPPGPISRPLLALGVAVMVPLARLLLAPLTLAWDRHR